MKLFFIFILFPACLFALDVKQAANQLIAAGKTRPDWTIDENFDSGLVSFGLQGKVVNLNFSTGKVTWSGFTPDSSTRLFWDAVVWNVRNINQAWITANCKAGTKFLPAFKVHASDTERVIVVQKGANNVAYVGVETGTVKYDGYTSDQVALIFWAAMLSEYPQLKAGF